MRKNFVFFVLIPAIIIFIIVYLFIDSWIESGLEYAGEQIVGAKVEIDNLKVTINPIGIEFSRLQVANPNDGWKNLFETGKVQFALNFGQLLRGKFIIETMEMNELIFGTKRSTDGSIPKPKKEAAKPSSSAESSTAVTKPSTPAVSFDIEKIKRELKIDSLLNPNNLATYRHIDSLKMQINDASVQWKTSLDEIEKSKIRIAEIETRANSIDVNKIKDLKSASDALENSKAILKEASEIKNTFQERKAVLTNSINRFSDDIKKVDNLIEDDFKKVLSMARLPDVSMKGLAEMLFGKDITNQAYEYLGYIEMAKNKIPKSSGSKPEKEKPPRLKGQNIHFPVEREYPKLWIKKILISGGTDKSQNPQYFYAKGQVLNITNDQKITGYPLTADIFATKGGTTSLVFAASFDRRKEKSIDNYKVLLTGLLVGDMSVGSSDFVPARITNTKANVSITIEVPENQLNSNTNINFSNMSLIFDREPKGVVEKIVYDVLSSIKGFNVNLRIWKNENKLDVAFTTDLDDQLASRTKQAIGAEIAKIQNDIRNKLNAKLAEKRAEIEKLYNEKREYVNNKLNEYENLINDKIAMIDSKKKEIENRIEQEKKKQTDSATEKAKDAIKGIFKKP